MPVLFRHRLLLLLQLLRAGEIGTVPLFDANIRVGKSAVHTFFRHVKLMSKRAGPGPGRCSTGRAGPGRAEKFRPVQTSATRLPACSWYSARLVLLHDLLAVVSPLYNLPAQHVVQK